MGTLTTSPSQKLSLFATLLLLILIPKSNSLRILVIFPLNGRSHWVMGERLVKSLASRGHQLDVYSHFPLDKGTSSLPNFKHYSLKGSLPEISNNMTYSEAVQFQALNAKKILEAVGTPICELMGLPVFRKLIKSPPRDPPYDLVIVELFMFDCYLAWGRRLNIPLIGVKASALSSWHNEALGNPINLALQPGAGSRFFGPMGFWQRLANFLQNLVVSGLFKQHMRADQNDIVERLFGKGYPDVVAMQRDLDLVLVNSHSSLNGLTPTVPSIVHVAGMHIDDGDGNNGSMLPQEVQKWLDDSKDGCIYFSFGSMIRIETFPESVLKMFYASFESIKPARVLLKVAKPRELPFGLPSNVMTQSWFSQVQVLKHKNVKAFVTHGGMLSSQEAIYTGVPMIGISIFGDQHLNVQANVERGIAIAVKLYSITEEKLTRAIKEILENKSYRENAEKLSKSFNDRPMKPLETAIFWIEYIARHGKKALRSPIVDMPWYKANLLDVYTFILIVVFLVYSILRLAFDKVYSLLRLPVKKGSRSKSKSNKYRWYQQLLLKTSPECSLYSFKDD